MFNVFSFILEKSKIWVPKFADVSVFQMQHGWGLRIQDSDTWYARLWEDWEVSRESCRNTKVLFKCCSLLISSRI